MKLRQSSFFKDLLWQKGDVLFRMKVIAEQKGEGVSVWGERAGEGGQYYQTYTNQTM